MSSSHLGIPKGTRDFDPQTMAKRQHIFKHIRAVFEKFAFQPLETPSMENLSVLSGKYGDEGDQLLYKILNSGDYLKNTTDSDYQQGYVNLLPKIASKGLRYDLTVPFARYVVMNRHAITFPFKRYQMQPVWRADRPQKGRYREFYQCDADVIGTDALLCEAEIVAMINQVFDQLGIDDFTIQINHRKLLNGISEAIGAPGRQTELAVSLDKLNKIGPQKVLVELASKGFEPHQLDSLSPVFEWSGSWDELQPLLEQFIGDSKQGLEGLEDMQVVYDHVSNLGIEDPKLVVNPCLARGLAYYTGTIFEVTINNAQIGSVCGGGRYDDLTGIFGLPGVSGVGISFGVDRIFDAMEQLQLFTEEASSACQVMLIAMEQSSEPHALRLLSKLRTNNVSSELYPDRAKLKKPLNYANKKGIPVVVLIGSQEIESGNLTVKYMESGDQEEITEGQLLKKLLATE